MAAIPKQKNLTVYRGDAWAIQLAVKDNGSVVDLTGIPILSQVKRDTNKTTPYLIQLRVEREDVDGIFVLYLTPEDTANLDSGTYKYDVQVGNSTLIYGDFLIMPDVSRAI